MSIESIYLSCQLNLSNLNIMIYLSRQDQPHLVYYSLMNWTVLQSLVEVPLVMPEELLTELSTRSSQRWMVWEARRMCLLLVPPTGLILLIPLF